MLPISWAGRAAAAPATERSGGSRVVAGGALPLTYHIGAGPAVVHLQVDFDWSTRPLYDVIATIPGSSGKNQWIIYGNHHDAWVNGASDPVSGASCSALETARTLSVLRKQGWQPKRTIMLALWDGEEYGLLGSTEWVEKHMDELGRNAAVYVNSDSSGRGPAFISGGSASLEPFLTEVMRDVTDPASSKSLLDAVRDRPRPGAQEPKEREREFHLDAPRLGLGLRIAVSGPRGYRQPESSDSPRATASPPFRLRHLCLVSAISPTVTVDIRQSTHPGDEHRTSTPGRRAGAARFDYDSLSASVTRWIERDSPNSCREETRGSTCDPFPCR